METIRVGLRQGGSRGRTEMKTLHLPHELIIQILLKLPVKSLLRFKCVCKSWFSLMSNPNFAKSHFQLAATHSSRILYISISPHKIGSIDFEASLKDPTASLNFDFPLPQSDFHFEIKASCRGFIFLRTSLNIYIWNPSTGIHKEVPLSPFESKLKAYYSTHLYGFGYDESNDDYVVVVLSCDRSLANASSHLELFSFRDNRWKEIEGIYLSYFNAMGSIGWLCNGAFHWLTTRYTFSVDVIVAFDIAERKLLEIPLPDDFLRAPGGGGGGFWDFGEVLSLWRMDCDTINIWVMKEYKVHSSWTLTHVLAINEIPYFSLICSTKSGHIIATDGGIGFLKYNNEGEFIEHISYCDQDGDIGLMKYNHEGQRLVSSSDLNLPSGFQVITYTESLLSLPGGNEQV